MHLDEFMNRFSRFRKTSPNPVHQISIYIYMYIYFLIFNIEEIKWHHIILCLYTKRYQSTNLEFHSCPFVYVYKLHTTMSLCFHKKNVTSNPGRMTCSNPWKTRISSLKSKKQEGTSISCRRLRKLQHNWFSRHAFLVFWWTAADWNTNGFCR